MSPLSKRTRENHYDSPSNVTWSVVKPNTSFPTRRDSKIIWSSVSGGIQLTESEPHHFDRKIGHYDSGGPFYTSNYRIFEKRGFVRNMWSSSENGFYTGPVTAPLPTTAERKALGFQTKAEFGPKNESSMKVLGTNAISYSAPTNPAVDLGTSLAETYRDGLPSVPGIQLWKDKTSVLRGLGSEYLNEQFGWRPLLDEIVTVAKVVKTSHGILQSAKDREGNDTHVRFSFPSKRIVSSSPATIPIPSGYPGSRVWSSAVASYPERQIIRTQETRQWFSADFTYALPEVGKLLGLGSNAYKLFGIALTPDVIWNLAPWSWAADWFSNSGEVINNITNFGLAGLVMRYGFIMEETIDRCEAVHSDGKGAGLAREAANKVENLFQVDVPGCSSGYELITKRRVPASPFGFSVGWEGLSPTQLAITAALGITRL